MRNSEHKENYFCKMFNKASQSETGEDLFKLVVSSQEGVSLSNKPCIFLCIQQHVLYLNSASQHVDTFIEHRIDFC